MVPKTTTRERGERPQLLLQEAANSTGLLISRRMHRASALDPSIVTGSSPYQKSTVHRTGVSGSGPSEGVPRTEQSNQASTLDKVETSWAYFYPFRRAQLPSPVLFKDTYYPKNKTQDSNSLPSPPSRSPVTSPTSGPMARCTSPKCPISHTHTVGLYLDPVGFGDRYFLGSNPPVETWSSINHLIRGQEARDENRRICREYGKRHALV